MFFGDIAENPGKLNDLLGNLSCRIWKYGDSYGKCDTVTNSAVVGSKQIGLFDHLLAARYVQIQISIIK